MSDILIKGMEMPKGCWWYDDDLRFHECWLTKVCHYHLTVGLYDNEYPDAEKSESCPLVEVPAHGDLKDADEILDFIHSVRFSESFDVAVVEGLIKKATTIIEANKEKEMSEISTDKVKVGEHIIIDGEEYIAEEANDRGCYSCALNNSDKCYKVLCPNVIFKNVR